MFSLIRGHGLILAVVFSTLAGCASYEHTKPAPAVTGPISITVKDVQLSSTTELPLGAYKIPESDAVIVGHQSGLGVASMFGIVGVMAAHSANSNSSAAGVSNSENLLRVRLADQLREEVSTLVSQPSMAGKFTKATGPTQLELSSALLLSYVDDTRVRPFTMVKVVLKGPGNRPLWETRYYATTGQPRPLSGTGSWTEKNGEVLKAEINASLQKTAKVILQDVSHPYHRDDTRMTVMTTDYPMTRDRVQMKGYHLGEDDRYVIFLPKVGDSLMSGVTIFDKSVAVYRPAASEDPGFKVVE